MHQATSTQSFVSSANRSWKMPGLGCCFLFTLLPATLGCSTFGLGNGRLVKELQSENERLLGEFRAERNRRESTEKSLRVMERRLAESEKLLARQFGAGQGRLSQVSTLRAQSPYAPPQSALPPITSDFEGSSAAQSYGTTGTNGLRWRRRSGGQ
ncbi:MAG: hypothetical protein ACE361_13505 [Aureliella sp.]